MTPKISALVSDVNGTLVTDDKILTPRARAALADLHARGVIFTIISSRPPRGLRMLLDPLEITTPIGGVNGGIIATPDLTVITHLLLPHIARRSVDTFCARAVAVWLFSGRDWLVRDPREHGWVAATVGAKSKAHITLTCSALENSRHAALLVVGKEKSTIFERFAAATTPCRQYVCIRPASCGFSLMMRQGRPN